MNWKIFVGVLFLAIFIGVAAFLIVSAVRNTASDVSVGGFGDEADSTFYFDVFKSFADTDCQSIITTIPDTLGDTQFGAPTSTTNMLEEFGAMPKVPLFCSYEFRGGQKATLTLYGYTLESYDASQPALISRINSSTMQEVIAEGEDSDTKYFIGTDSNLGMCRVNFFQNRNEFEYAQLLLEDTNCEYLEDDSLILGLTDFFNVKVLESVIL